MDLWGWWMVDGDVENQMELLQDKTGLNIPRGHDIKTLKSCNKD